MTRVVHLLTVLCLASPVRAQIGADSASRRMRQVLTSRADSLARLDPTVELALALRHQDRRFIGIQGYARVAPGVPPNDRLYPKQDAMRVIEGTSDNLWAPEVERLTRIGASYAARYNQMLLRELRRRAGAQRPAARSWPGASEITLAYGTLRARALPHGENARGT